LPRSIKWWDDANIGGLPQISAKLTLSVQQPQILPQAGVMRHARPSDLQPGLRDVDRQHCGNMTNVCQDWQSRLTQREALHLCNAQITHRPIILAHVRCVPLPTG